MHPPKVFISATSGDLRSIRQVVKEALLTIGCHPVEQTNFGPDWCTIGGLLRAKLEGCQALVHLAGMRYGAEPDTEAEEKRALQCAHRTRLMDSPRLYEQPATPDDIHARILAVPEQVLTLQQQQTEVRHEVRGLGRKVLAALAIMILIHLATPFKAHGQPGDADKRLDDFTRSLGTQEPLLKANPGSAQAVRDVSATLEKLDDLRVLNWKRGDADKRLAAALEKLGDLLQLRWKRGDADKGLDYYTRSLETQEALLQANPGSAQAVREVAATLEKLGDLLVSSWPRRYADQGLVDYFTRSLATQEALLKANPASAQAVREVAATLEKLGDLLELRCFGAWASVTVDPRRPLDGEERTLAYYTRSLDLRETLLKASPGSAEAMRDVSASLIKLGYCLTNPSQFRNPDKAVDLLDRALELTKTLLKADPRSNEAAANMHFIVGDLATLLKERGRPGDADKAMAYYTRYLEFAEAQLKAYPRSKWALRDVAVTHRRMAQVAERRGDAKEDERHRRAFCDLLQPALEGGVIFDPFIVDEYGKLQAKFAK